MDLSQRFADSVFPLEFDVTNAGRVSQAVREGFEHFGRVDVLVNNAGYSLIATTEKGTEEQIADLFDVNYTGVVRVLRAALPLMRKQEPATFSASQAASVSSRSRLLVYSATKAAAEALHEALAKEVAQFGIKVTMIEPGAYATEFGKSATRANTLEVYDALRKDFIGNLMKLECGNPKATAEAILKVVDATEPPLRLILGGTALPEIQATYSDRIVPGMPGRVFRIPRNKASGPR